MGELSKETKCLEEQVRNLTAEIELERAEVVDEVHVIEAEVDS